MTTEGPTLSLCLIFKNEGLYLRDAVESVLPIVNECILVDSGSSDNSEKIVRDLETYHPEVKYFLRPWPGDFSNQKNFAIEQATSDWILFLDGDERVFKEDHARLLEAIKSKDFMAYDLPIRNYTNDFTEYGYQVSENQFASGYIKTHLHRLFRRHPQIRYSGILHERIEPSLQALGAKSLPLDTPIHHLGPLKAKTHHLEEARYVFYEDLGRKKTATDPSNAQAHWELGVVLQKQKKISEASGEFKKAFELDPTIEEFEVYYCLSLFQQENWPALKAHPLKFRKAGLFRYLALAQTDAKVIEELDQFKSDFAQVTLFIFELSLMHNRLDRIENDREEAAKLFGKTGLVEFLEGSVKRKNGNLTEAIALLQTSQQKGCVLADRELQLMK